VGMEEDYKLVVDNVHGIIKLYPLPYLIINTNIFKRLKDIMQLQATHEVFPTANHSRFEHSLGVMHLARKLCEKLGASKEDTDMVEVAGLCHDLGHGPYSHLWERFVGDPRIENSGFKWEHEESSYEMLRLIMEEQPEIKEHISDHNLLFIKELICGGDKEKHEKGFYPYSARGPEKLYLYEVISNKQTGMDVDKMDYLLRDAKALKIKLKWELSRFLEAGEPKPLDFPYSNIDPTIVKRIAVREKVTKNIQQLFSDRVDLHANAYQHKTVKMFDLMYVDMWIEADPHITVTTRDGRELKLSQACEDATALAQLTDAYVIGRIANSSGPELAPARAILKRINHRKKYKCVGHIEVALNESEENIKEKWKEEDYSSSLREFSKLPEKGDIGKLGFADLAISKVNINMGMGRRNPVEKALFYKKDSTTGYMMDPNKLKKYCPESIQDSTLLIFCRSEEEAVVEAARQVVDGWRRSREWTEWGGLNVEVGPSRRPV